MSSPPDVITLDSLLEDNIGDEPGPNLRALFEPYGEEMVRIAEDFDPECQSWRDYRGAVWSPVPDAVIEDGYAKALRADARGKLAASVIGEALRSIGRIFW